MTAINTDEIVELIEYARTADIAGDPLVIDLAASLSATLARIAELEQDLRIASVPV